MGRILAIDFGEKRVGLAVTDPLQIIATPLDTIERSEAMDFIQNYCVEEEVSAIVLGMPKNLDNEDTDATQGAMRFHKGLQKRFPDTPIHLEDERFTSKIALDTMIQGGTSKKYRRDKSNLDKLSATLILQTFLERKHT
ncbi:MAG: Holliday junction resolvase RuvX [Bacteroidota bacterium]